MGDKTYQHGYRGLLDHDFTSRSLSLPGQTGAHSLDTTPAMHYRPSAAMASGQQPSPDAVKSSTHGLDTIGAAHYQNPVAMWQHVPSQASNLAAMSMVPHNQQQHPTAALNLMFQSQGLRYYPAPPSVKMFSSPLQHQQQQQHHHQQHQQQHQQHQQETTQFYHASIACSKRFSEEEKQKLERVFTAETQKPSTNRKRQLAEELGCPVPKVNNWFQNRRAREKQMHRVQEYEARQAADKAASQIAGNPVQEDDDDNDDDDEEEEEDDVHAVSSDNDSMSDRKQTSKSPSGHFSETDLSSAHGDPAMDCSPDAHDSSDPVATSTLGAGGRVKESGEMEQVFKLERQDSPHTRLSDLGVPLPATAFEGHQGILSSSPDAYPESQDAACFETLQSQLMPGYSSLGQMSGLGGLNGEVKHAEYFSQSTSYIAQRTPTITTNMIGHDEMEDQSARRASEISEFPGFGSLSPDTFPPSSPAFHERDASGTQVCPSASIALRRKIRPPQRLNQTALRDFSNGPKTGVESTRRSEMLGTIRRAASATGPLSGKIVKSGPPVSPLSPRSFDPSILEQLARTSSLTVRAATFKEPSSVSPVGPTFEQQFLSADNSGLGSQQRSASLSLSRFEEAIGFSPASSDYNRDGPLNSIRSHSFQQFPQPKFLVDAGCGNVTPDEALTTPGLSQFGSELEFPMSLSVPRYVESEPATPSLVPTTLPASSMAHGQGFPTLKLETPPQTDMFPWSRSPDQLSVWNGTLGQLGEPQSQTFQFQPNITPQNFNSPTGA